VENAGVEIAVFEHPNVIFRRVVSRQPCEYPQKNFYCKNLESLDHIYRWQYGSIFIHSNLPDELFQTHVGYNAIEWVPATAVHGQSRSLISVPIESA